MGKYDFAPILTPDNINKLHRELSKDSQKALDDMADYLGENYCRRFQERCPGEKIHYLRREKAREIIYVLVLQGYL